MCATWGSRGFECAAAKWEGGGGPRRLSRTSGNDPLDVIGHTSVTSGNYTAIALPLVTAGGSRCGAQRATRGVQRATG